MILALFLLITIVSGAQVVVFDAGSSGTRAHVFNFVWEDVVPKLDIQKLETQTKRVEPGLSSLANKNDIDIKNTIHEIFIDLLNFVKVHVPISARKRTPILVKATAGMRLVDISKQKNIMTAVRQQLIESEFLFTDPDEWASIISGHEEAGLAWVAANFLKGAFDQKKTPTVGVIEMGGASSQISFEIYNQQTIRHLKKNRRFDFIDFFGHHRIVYAMSYLGFGRDQAYDRMDVTFASATTTSMTSTLKNPCHTKSYNSETHSKNGFFHAVQGTGNYNQCVIEIENFLFNASVFDQPPVIPGTKLDQDALLPATENEFITTEVFFYVRDNMVKNKNMWMNLEPSVVENFGKLVCAAAAPSSRSGDGGDGDGDDGNDFSKLREDSCFTVGFQSIFLKNIGLVTAGVNQKNIPIIIHEINGAQVEWAIGAAIQYLIQHNTPLPDGMISNGATTSTDERKQGLLQWGFSETIMFALVVTFVVLSSLVVLARFVQSFHCLCLDKIGRYIFLHGSMRRKQQRRQGRGRGGGKLNRSGGGGGAGRHSVRGGYDRVRTAEEDENDDDDDVLSIEMNSSTIEVANKNNNKMNRSIPAKGPTALKWKMSDEGI